MKLQFAVWIAIIVLSHKSTCTLSDVNQVASERRDIDFESPSDYNDEESAERIMENDLLFETSLNDLPGSNVTQNSSSTSDIPQITWSLVSSSKNSASQFAQDDTSTVPQSKTLSLLIGATTSTPLNQNSSAFPNFTSSFSHALDSGDNELDSDISTDHIPGGDFMSSKDDKISSNATTTSYPTTEFLVFWPENKEVNSSDETTTNFANESYDETTTDENAFKDIDHTENDMYDVFNSSDYLNFTSVDDFPNNANTSEEDDYATFIPDITTNNFNPFETDVVSSEIDEGDTGIASSTVNHTSSPSLSELTSPVISAETSSPSLMPEDIFTQTFGTESHETVQGDKHQMIEIDSEPTTLRSNHTETPFLKEGGLDSTENNTTWAYFNPFLGFGNESTDSAVEAENNLAPLDAKTKMESAASESFTVSPSTNGDEYFQTTEIVTKATNPTELVPVHPLFTDATTETVTNDAQYAKQGFSSTPVMFTASSSSSAHTDVPENELEKSVTLLPDNISNSLKYEINDALSNITTTHLDYDVFNFETSTPDIIVLSSTVIEISLEEDTTLNEVSTQGHQAAVNGTRYDSPIPTTTLKEIEISPKHQDGSVTGDDELDNELFHSSNTHPSTTKRKYFSQSPTLPYNADDSETMPSISTEAYEFFHPSKYDLREREFNTSDPKLHLVTTISSKPEQFDTQDQGGTVSNETPESSSTVINSESTTIPGMKESTSNELEFGNSIPSSQEVTETYREGKHIPFSTRTAYERRPTKPTVPSSANPNFHTANNEVGALYNQIRQEDLTPDDKRNVITAILQIHPLHYEREELNEKIIIAHLWLLHAIVEGYKNNSLNLTADVKRGSSTVAFEKLPKISYVLPTPEINIPNITLSFVAQLLGQNDTLPADYLVNILNVHKEDLRILANVKSVKFFHGLPMKEYDFLTAIVERYGIIVLVTCVVAVAMIMLLICVVVYYRRKARHSAHCLTNDKLHRNMQEAMGIDLNPAVIILQDEIREKTALNGNKICSIDDDEGWLAPIDDVPMPEDSNGPCMQDTKL